MGATVTSFYFLCFLLAAILIYFLVPKRFQWCVLLVSSIAYYLLSGNEILLVYPAAECLVAYLGTRVFSGASTSRGKQVAFVTTLLLLLGVLFVLKYINFGINSINLLAGKEVLHGFSFLIPLGISFYTFSLLSYIIDVYNGLATVQKNFLKLLLYGMYFPAILSGPILRYREDGEQFFKPHAFSYHNLVFGAQRMLWGFFKTLVISERMGCIVDTIYGDYNNYPGTYVFLGTVCFAFQLYSNFSGCMDIVLGISEIFGLKLPENFETPFFAKNISEYWRRWHITLGVWMKEYVFYPLLRTNLFARLGKSLRGKLGKKRGKQLTTFLAMLILWFTVGIWHGGDWKYVIGSGLLHWFYIVMGELLTPSFAWFMKKLHIKSESWWVNGFRILRTFFLVNIGFVFFRAESVQAALVMLKNAVSVFNPGVLYTGTLFTVGLDWVEFIIAVVSLLLLLTVSILQQKGSVRVRIEKLKLPVRWIIWYALLFYTILLGYYGPGYSAAEFIYQGF